ncbi:MAG: hypothetical protein QOH47_1904 [Sphingomonadales bacterium]|jgi:uncharacterized protein (DUF2235 family)|nr:hypothetical protein [Sphingomonadales bacterium]
MSDGLSKTRAGKKRAEAPPKAKSIILFSDGTGNSSAKLFKTNVWRMYEAIELGATAIAPEQIVYYDEGVGNSGFRPLAILGGVFGWGLKRNVLDLYSFLCRNYERDDRIYVFGFSRGAFTIRVLVGLIASQGLVPYRDEADLAHQAADAFRAHVRGRVPRYPPMRYLLPLWHALIRLILRGKRLLFRQHAYRHESNRFPRIRFIGVWDTVAAYGGPVLELVRAFDDWIRPLTFKDQILSDKVDCARHALALDEERDAFQPVPWDEPHGTDRERIKQVWFAGVHADVGGGYPDDSLAYVSLAWMMKEAQAAELELRPEKVAEANRIANAFGPIHDSRAGVGAYYRYQPRMVGAYVEPPAPGTESIEDPVFHDQGMDQCAWVHESVLYRVEAGTDGYAPITLPRDFCVVDHSPRDVQFPQVLRRRLRETSAPRADRQETAKDWVWVKRILYFATVAASLWLAVLPLWPAPASFCTDERCVLGTVFGWLKFVLPGFAEPWVDAFAAQPDATAILVVLVFLFMAGGKAAERRLRDKTRLIWKQALAGSITLPARVGPIRAMRTSPLYQAVLGFIKWRLLPFVFGLAMLLLLAWAATVAAVQVRLATGEGRGLFCTPQTPAMVAFDTAEPCNRTGLRLRRNRSYEMVFHLRDDWRDGNDPANDTDPRGIAAGDLSPPIGYLAALMRRVVSAGYLQPVAAIETGREMPAVQMHVLNFTERSPRVFAAEFTATADGELILFANDAVPAWPFRAGYFYRGSRGQNHGTACVSISERVRGRLEPIVSCDPRCAQPGAPCTVTHPPRVAPPPPPPGGRPPPG